MSQKKLLILNGSHSEVPLINSGKQLGYHVITTGNEPSLIGHNYSDEYHHADFSDKEAILDLSIKLKIDAICSSANDFGAITAAYVAEKMGLPGHDSYDTALVIHHKDRFKKFSIENNIQTPFAHSYRDKSTAFLDKNKFDYPVIIKPIDLTGGKGISIVTSEEEYQGAIDKAFHMSRAKRIVVEKFIEGTQHSFSTFIINHKVAFYFSDNEYSFINPFLVSTSAAPSINIENFSTALVKEAENIASSLKIVDGILHIQYLANGDNFHIIEVTRRCSGDLYPLPVSLSSNIIWENWIVRAECGLSLSNFPNNKQTGYCGRHCIMSPKNGIIENIIISEDIKNNIHSELMWWQQGDKIDEFMTQKLGVVILSYATMDEMYEKTQNLNNLIRVKLY